VFIFIIENVLNVNELDIFICNANACLFLDAIGVTSGGRHLWEFIRDLLRAGERYNGGPGTVIVPEGPEGAKPVAIDTIIRWENRDDGVFRIIDSKIVAQLWGCRKHNSTMTYEKLSRALRYVT